MTEDERAEAICAIQGIVEKYDLTVIGCDDSFGTFEVYCNTSGEKITVGWLYRVSTTGSNKFGTVTKTKGIIKTTERYGGLIDYNFKGRNGETKYIGSNINLFDGYYYDRCVYLENENDARAREILAENIEHQADYIESNVERLREVVELLRGK